MTLRQLTLRQATPLALASLALIVTGCQSGKHGGGTDNTINTSSSGGSGSGGSSGGGADGSGALLAAIPGAKKVAMAFPTGERDTSAVLLEKEIPGEVVLGQEFAYRIAVENLTDNTLDTVRLTDSIPEGFNVLRTEPAADTMGTSATWLLGALAPGASKTVTVTGIASSAGQFTTCATVDYESSLCSSVAVVSPALELMIAAPSEGLVCDPLDLTVTVTNAGTGDGHRHGEI